MDLLEVAAQFTRIAPRSLGTRIGWHLGERAPRRPRIARLKMGGRLVVDARDYQQRPILFRGEYEPEVSRCLSRIAIRNWCVLDVGANVGYFAVIAAYLGGPDAKVIAFEPNQRIADMLACSIGLNRELDITLERAACGDIAGISRLHLSPEDRNSGLSTLRDDIFPQAVDVAVDVVRLDEYCAKQKLSPDLVKIDAEGWELEVLRGAGWIIDERVPSWILCEVAPARSDPATMLTWMDDRGYRCFQIAETGELSSVATLDKDWETVCFTRV
jgi:FkbM family methyltransferase